MDNKKPLGISIFAGLGNQLYMLFAGISKAIDENRNFIIYRTINNHNRTYYFHNILTAIKDKDVIVDNIWNLPLKSFNDNNDKEFIPDNYDLIRGYFQNFKLSYHNKNKIIKLLEFDNFINKYKFPFKTIGIHFRFDDALRPDAIFLVAKPSYFIKAIEKLQEELKKRNDNNYYRYVIFSTQKDDNYVNEYIKEINRNLKTPIDFIKSYDYFNNNNDYEEIFYISNCDHFILPHGSTFSLFGNYLTYKENSEKIVIYSNIWDGYGRPPTKRYFFEDWIRLYE